MGSEKARPGVVMTDILIKSSCDGPVSEEEELPGTHKEVIVELPMRLVLVIGCRARRASLSVSSLLHISPTFESPDYVGPEDLEQGEHEKDALR